jgi:hypothetical protein
MDATTISAITLLAQYKKGQDVKELFADMRGTMNADLALTEAEKDLLKQSRPNEHALNREQAREEGASTLQMLLDQLDVNGVNAFDPSLLDQLRKALA